MKSGAKPQCNVFWGSHGCDRKLGHSNPIHKCENHSFLHYESGTILTKNEIAAFLAGDRTVGIKSQGYWRQEA